MNNNGNISIIFPNQLFEKSPLIKKVSKVFLIEEHLFFNHFNFHKQKLIFLRASMKCYYDYLVAQNIDVHYIEATNEDSDIRKLIEKNSSKIQKINIIDPVDEWLLKRIKISIEKFKLSLTVHQNPSYITSEEDFKSFFRKDKKKFFQTSFYKKQRLSTNTLMINGSPEGGKWTFDDQNRNKFPKNKSTPKLDFQKSNTYYTEAIEYVSKNFPDNLGELPEKNIYPINFKSSKKWLNDFLKSRFNEFGIYQDAILKEKSIINHSLISPLLNAGLLDTNYVINETINFYYSNNIPINSCEGFIRQLIGWREFIRGVYIAKGNEERTNNFWNFNRKIPNSFYDGSTGISPVDDTIKKIIKTGYANHIERLMIIGNFMLLCEFDPDEVYKWFMELFIDAYDWVMVPNVYGMSQFADGGLMSTKPYISSSNYILKMSNYQKGDWCEIWDALFWNFIDKQRKYFKTNPRLNMMVFSFDKMNITKKEKHLMTADRFIKNLDKQNV